MTSLFEHLPVSGSEMPIDLIARDVRGVSLLEFAPLYLAQTPEPEPPAEPEFVVDERAAQMTIMIQAAREEAAAEARSSAESEAQARIAEERERVQALSTAFASDRQRYFAAAEAQVIHLALAIARRVLCREVQGDPAFLQAAVGAALSRVQDDSQSTLRVSPADERSWLHVLAQVKTVSVRTDERILSGECLLETSVGKVELGIEPQMREVERSFDDLLSRQTS